MNRQFAVIFLMGLLIPLSSVGEENTSKILVCSAGQSHRCLSGKDTTCEFGKEGKDGATSLTEIVKHRDGSETKTCKYCKEESGTLIVSDCPKEATDFLTY